MAYELYYWTGIPGRGEFVRLALEEAGAAYVDIAQNFKTMRDGAPALMAFMQRDDIVHPPFAAPFLKDGDRLIGQTSAILLYLGDRHGLAPKDEDGRLWTHQIQLTIADLVGEAHDAHHPLGGNFWYHEQKEEARRRTEHFREHRIPRFIGWLEKILARNPAGTEFLVASALTYADLSLFQAVEGLAYAFPKQMARTLADTPLVAALRQRVASRPRIKGYLASGRRQPFNADGVFRHYPELDV